ncbi:TetR family transcriptional regulator [Streptomyces endophytica]|uniref:TetR/AcrR family transcriptional regulator n=1 Tax=Streptomyces endophytica TaxID=2991496 RepID=A0ABY6P731_9ACTN|nr:helix-turn-helix domain-containing protein [Streptomyces endophytica]UZJ29215.1 TetR/AcrR family transcriptional regulator [Streptomyces endophytica]
MAAAEIFNEYGYEAATIAAIIERAKLTRGALYFHFTSKRSSPAVSSARR